MGKKILTISTRDAHGQRTIELDDPAEDKFKPSTLLPWSAFLISLTALCFSIFQTFEARQHDRLSVIPSISIARFGRLDPDFGISIENNGIGPAKLKRVEARVQGEFTDEFEVIRNKLCDKFQSCQESSAPEKEAPIMKESVPPGILVAKNISYTSFFQNRFIQPGKLINLIDVHGLNVIERKDIWAFISSNNSLEIRLTFCSVYDECSVVCLHTPGDSCASLPMSR